MLNGKSIVAGFIIGGTISAATALLTAPTSGRVLRNQVRSQGMEWKQIIEDIIKDGWKLKDQIAQTSKEGAALINELTEEMKTSVDEWKNTVEPHQNNIHQYLERSEEHTSELQSRFDLVCRLLLEKKNKTTHIYS